MAEVAHQQAHTFPFNGNPRIDGSTQFHDDELGTSIEQQEWFSFPIKSTLTSKDIKLGNPAMTASAQQTLHTHLRGNNSTNALPSFSFNPGQSSAPSIPTSDRSPMSTVSAPSTPVRAGRHRRTASELIGGNAKINIGNIRSGSPNREWADGFTLPTTMLSGSLPSCLEHRHRRTDIMTLRDPILVKQRPAQQPNSSLQPMAGVVPESEAMRQPVHDQTDTALPCSSLLSAKPRVRHDESRADSTNTPRTPVRHRVGFSDTLEFIPRPLSTISSESGSSMSTIRAHSMSGSISSIMCSGASSPLSKLFTSPAEPPINSTESQSRGLSASPSSGVVSTTYYSTDDIQAHVQRPSSASATLDRSHSSNTEPLCRENVRNDDSRGPIISTETQKGRRIGPWTSLLSRKPKADISSQQTSPPIDVVETASSVDIDISGSPELSEDFDADPTSIIISDAQTHNFTSPVTPPVTPNESKKFGDNLHATTASSMIDLDAALETEPVHDGRFHKGRSLSEARRSMHSYATASGFLNTNVHRRADSAPALTLNGFDSPGFRERNSSISSFKRPQMEDVFEEDEDDSPPKQPQAGFSTRRRVGLGVDVHDCTSANMTDHLSLPPTPSELTGTLTHSEFASRKLRFDAPWKSHRDFRDDSVSYAGSEPADATSIDGLTCDVSVTPSYSGSFTRPIVDGQLPRHHRRAGSDTFPLPNRFGNVPIRTGSPLSSSNCGCGNDCSVFSPRELGTSPGVDMRKAYAQSVVEGGSDLRCSVDDVPSLTSSGSTVVSNAHVRAPSSSRSYAPRSTGSSLSLSSAFERRRKRSSIASFSRLVGGPFSDRPRTALEPGKRWQTPLGAGDLKQQKSSRLSRILKFWKAKDAIN